jgi:hypothetical protein
MQLCAGCGRIHFYTFQFFQLLKILGLGLKLFSGFALTQYLIDMITLTLSCIVRLLLSQRLKLLVTDGVKACVLGLLMGTVDILVYPFH